MKIIFIIISSVLYSEFFFSVRFTLYIPVLLFAYFSIIIIFSSELLYFVKVKINE